MRANNKSLLKVIRRKVTPAEQAIPLIVKLEKTYSSPKFKDYKTGRPLFKDTTKKEFKALIKHLQDGCLNDIDDVPLYYPTGTVKEGLFEGLQSYRCVRGTSNIEGGIHSKLIKNMDGFSYSPELMAAHLDNVRSRYNIRSSSRNRPNFPFLGHYDYLYLDYISMFTKEVYGKQQYPWYTVTFNERIGPLSFGFVPLQPAEQREEVTMQQLNLLKSPMMKFLALAQKSRIPYLPVSTSKEIKLFLDNLPNYREGKSSFRYQDMAEDWNNGNLGEKRSYGTEIFFKLPCHLQAYENEAFKLMTKRIQSLHIIGPLQMLQREIDQTSSSVETPAQREPIVRTINHVCIVPECNLTARSSKRDGFWLCNNHLSNSSLISSLLEIDAEEEEDLDEDDVDVDDEDIEDIEMTDIRPSELEPTASVSVVDTLPSEIASIWSSPPRPLSAQFPVVPIIPVAPQANNRPRTEGELTIEYAEEISRQSRKCKNCLQENCYGSTSGGGKGRNCTKSCCYQCALASSPIESDRCYAGYVNTCKTSGLKMNPPRRVRRRRQRQVQPAPATESVSSSSSSSE